MTPDALKVLADEQPQFQVASGSAEFRSSEAFFFDRGGADTAGLQRSSQALEDEGLRFLASTVSETDTTLEVGGGASTVVFASRARRHYCVNPDRTANELVGDFLDAHGFDRARVTFISESSDRALPELELGGSVQVALIDGNHSFPFAIIDWHYIEPHVAVGGLIMVDNRSINGVRVLCDFLDQEQSYRMRAMVGDCAVYEKLGPRAMGWSGQGINSHDFVGYKKVNAEYVARRAKRVARRLLKR